MIITDFIVLKKETNRMCAIFKTENDANKFINKRNDIFKMIMKKTTLPKPCAHLESIKNNWLSELLWIK